MTLRQTSFTLLMLIALLSSFVGSGQDKAPKDIQSSNIGFGSIDSLELISRIALEKHDYYAALKSRIELQRFLEGRDIMAFEASKQILSGIYYKLGHIDEAIDLANQSIEFYSDIDPKKSIPSLLLLAQIKFEEEDYDLAEEYLRQARKLGARSLENEYKIRYLLLLAQSKAHAGDTLNSFEILDLANDLCLEMNEPQVYADLQLQKGKMYLDQNNWKEATKAILKSKKVSRELNDMYSYIEALGLLLQLAEKNENYERAYPMLSELTHLKDSLSGIQKAETIAELIIKYESRKKQKEIIDLEGQKRLTELKSRRTNLTTYALLISFIAVLAAAYFIITFYQQKLSSNQIILDQKEQINNQKIKELNNILQIQSMQSMMKGQEQERERVAKDLHDSLGGLLSTIKLRFDSLLGNEENKINDKDFNQIHTMLDDACQEVRNISSDLQPGALEQLGLIDALNDLINKYTERTNSEIEFLYYGMDETRLDTFISLNIYRIIQELLNNSLKHAEAKEILVQLNRGHSELMVMVEDDGKGYNPENVSEGMGSENVRSRVNFLNGDINIQSAEGEGTSTLITVPL